MLCPTAPASVMMSVNTRGDSATTPLAVRCGSGMGTRTARTLTSWIVGEEAPGMCSPFGTNSRGPETGEEQAARAGVVFVVLPEPCPQHFLLRRRLNEYAHERHRPDQPQKNVQRGDAGPQQQ